MVKNTLFKLAADGVFEVTPELEAALSGPTAAVFAKTDGIAVAKVLSDYIADQPQQPAQVQGRHRRRQVRVGGRHYQDLANIPPREVLLAQFVGAFTSALVELLRDAYQHRRQKRSGGGLSGAAIVRNLR